MSDDLSPEALAEALGARPVQSYRALLSTDAAAVAWARAGGPAGGAVVAEHQAVPRGRGGLVWSPRPDRDLCFSLVLRPAMAPDDEGWLYVAAGMAVADVLGEGATVEWPDRLEGGGRHLADVAGHAGLGAGGVDWAVVNVLVRDAARPRGPLIARLAQRIEELQAPDAEVLAAYRERCATLGREVVAHVIPTWPDGVQIAGTAESVNRDGALVIAQDDGRRIAVRPQHLARIEPRGEIVPAL